MSDGSRLRQSWSTALTDAETHFRQLLTSPSNEWRRVTSASEGSPSKKGKAKASAIPELTDVVVHRKPSKAGDDIYRLVLDVPLTEELVSLEPWKAVLTTPELRQEWDPAVDEAHLLEVFDHTTRIAKTNFTLGWPANPRDAVTISRAYHDTSTVIDITTSLPRSADEPAYLRPSPPFVRSHIPLLAWCIQHIQPQPSVNSTNDALKKKPANPAGKIRITCFWQHDLKSMWGFGTTSSLTQQLSTMTLGLLKSVLKRGTHVPKLTGYGIGVSVERLRFQVDREALTIDYSIIPEDESTPAEGIHGMKDVHALREYRRLTRSIECILPSSEGWDVRVTTKASSEEVEKLPWSAHAIRSSSSPSSSQTSMPPDQIVFRLSHAPLIDDHSVLKVKIVIERSGPSSGLRLNGLPQTIQDVEDRDPSSYFISQQIFQDVSSAVDLSFQSTSSLGTVSTTTSTDSTQGLVGPVTERTPAAEKSILSRVRRNYIYFSSLLQEPEAKWRRTTEGRGVAITQLDSIDPTLVVYRAEATFVGVGLWDLFGAVVSPGAKIFWDKQHEDAVLLEDVNELTELWHYKTRPAWPVNGRDSVVLKTVYKSPTAIHVFSFSADDTNLFPTIPPVEPNVIRTQVDLQGWAIEALSPTTTQLTLLEQSDPKGWANKTSIPTQMINLLAGTGEFAIKCGGPPVITRLAGAKANELRYDHERSSFRIEYEASSSRRAVATNNASSTEEDSTASPAIECELRCDLDTWAPSLDIVVDPPPQTVTCLRRHRLSLEGGGLWITMTHDALFVDDDRLLTIVRRAPGKEKGLVMINGAKVHVDVEELPEAEIKQLSKQKRVKPPRIPLDQPPVVSAIRRRKAEWDADAKGTPGIAVNTTNSAVSAWASAPRISSPLTRFFSYAVDQATTTTQQAVAAISPAVAMGNAAGPSSLKAPMQYALDALAWTQETHAHFPSTGWELISEKGLPVHKKLAPEICSVIPVHKGFKVIEGVSAEELAAVITEPDCQRKWDDRYDSSFVLESFGGKSRTSFVVSKAGFPWRDRGFYVASVMARSFPALSRRNTAAGEVAEQSNSVRNAVFCVSASFSPDSVALFAPGKYNAYALPIGRVYLDAWILETLDPYTKENYAIPSTRCTRLVAVDFAGAIPAAVNSMINATLPRSILALETYIKGLTPHPLTRLPAPGLVITDKKVEGHLASTGWKLRKRDEERVLVNTKYSLEDKVYVATILIAPRGPSAGASPNPSGSNLNALNTEAAPSSPEQTQTPRASRVLHRLGSPTAESGVGAGDSLKVDGRTSPITIPDEYLLTPRPPNFTPSPSSSPPGPSPPPALRQRSASSSSPPNSYNSHTYIRGRTISSAFTPKGEVRAPTDLLVAEIVVDSKLYPEGYDVLLRSRLRPAWAAGVKGEFVPLRAMSSVIATSTATAAGSNAVSSLSTTTTTTDTATDGLSESVLPLVYTIHTMPSSPLHSSGLNEGESPTRHLLRLSLPTAQYQVSTVLDPLTGETRSAPPRPAWLVDMRGGAVVEVEVRPRKDPGVSVGTVGSVRGLKSKETKPKDKVRVDGKEVVVLGEKESLTALGREELLDDRVAKMDVLSRIPSESEPLPQELKLPVGIADDLLDPTTTSPATRDGTEPIKESNSVTERSPDEGSSPSKEQDAASPPSTLTPRVPQVASPGGLLGFLHAYNNPLITRFTSANANASTSTTTTNDTATDNNSTSTGSTNSDGPPSTAEGVPRTKESGSPKLPGGLGETEAGTTTGTMARGRQFGMSSVLVVALIAFLIGSLLRSLISPADFVYFVSDGKEAEKGSGWREIRRLFELKSVVGGWDLQVAVQVLVPVVTHDVADMASVSQSDSGPPQQLESALSWEGEKMFNIYIHDYCNKRGFVKTARELMTEAEIPPEATPPINARQGLLFEWWSVFWVLFTAKANGHGSDDAIIYTQHQANQMAQRNRMPPQTGQTNAAGQPPQPNMPHHQTAPMPRAPNGINGRPTMMNFGPNGMLPNGVPPPGPGAPNTFMAQPNGIPTQPGVPLPQGVSPGQTQPFQLPPGGQRASIGGMPPQQNPQQSLQPQRGPNPNGPFQSPSMPTSPQNPPGAPQLQQQHTQPPMGQLGPSPHLQMSRGGMLPPHQGMNPMNPQGPQGSAPPPQQYPQMGRSPSRAATPSQQGGLLQPSPSMSHRQPPGMQMTPDIAHLNGQVMNIPTATIAQIKAELGLEGRDINTLSNAEKMKVMQLYRSKFQQGPVGGPLPDNATAGPSNPMMQIQNQQRANNPQQRNQPPQQPQRGGKRSSTSPGEEHETLPHNDTSPPDRKRPRRSPTEQHAALPMNYNPQAGQMMMNPQGGQMMVNPQGGPGMMVIRGPGPGPPMGMNGAPHPGQPPMGGPMGMGPMGMGAGPQPPMGMQHIPGGVPPGGAVGGMPPQMGHQGPLTPHMQNQQMQAREAMRHTAMLAKGPGPQPGGLANMNAGSPSASDPAAHFNLGAGPLSQGPPGGQPGFAQNRMNKNNMMPPPSPALNGPPKDGKGLMPPGPGSAKGPGPGPMPNQGMPPTANHGSPRNPPPGPGPIAPPGSGVPTPGSLVNGGGPPTPAPGPQVTPGAQGPLPPGGGMMPSPSPSTILGAGAGVPPPSSASSMDGLFPTDFINSVAGGLDDFQFDLSQGTAGDINFERDFGQWFNNPDDPMSLDGMK
ncbi:hypothetical protein H0H92_008065 [Tricholoma furcatifolium]|nr:hypothetical protein H0H92_008065 [Tricholoma furcatifolium]